MRDKDRSKAQLIKELVQLRQRVAQLEAAQAERGEAEQAITTSEEKYRGLFENAAAGIGISNAEGRVLALNKAMTQITGYTLEQFSKVDMGDTYVDPEARNEFLEIMQRDGVVENFEVQLIHKSGQPYWVSISTRPISYEEQDAYLTTALDINERVRMEEALHESRTKYETLLNSAPVGIWEADPDGRGGYINPKLGEIAGMTQETAEGEGWASGLHPDDQERVFGEWTAFVQGKAPYHLTYRFRHPDGTVHWAIGQAAVVRTKEDEHIGFVGTLTDITKRVEAEEEREKLMEQLSEQANYVQQIIATVPEGMLLLSADHRVLLANPMAMDDLPVLAGATAGDKLTHLGNRSLTDLLTSPPTKGLWHEIEAADRTFEVIARPMENGPEAENWVLVIKDVTQEREIQSRHRQQERLAAVGQLAAGIAHDFNNIMTVIVLHTEMGLRLPDIPAKLHQRLETISNQAKRAIELIQQILDFGRRAVLARQPIDLASYMNEMVELLERTIPENIKIDLNFGSDDYTVNADPTRIQQAIMNLAINARDVMPSGGDLRIGLSRTEETDEISCVDCGLMDPGEWVRIIVKDTGAGIASDALPHIFEPFFTTKEPGKGSGLGLAQVYGIVKQHAGHIDVATEKGGGTTFIMYLPPLMDSSPVAVVLEEDALVQGQGETVMVVEDEKTLRESLADALELLNYEVLKAANGREALAMLDRHENIDLVLSDLVMPEMGGQALFSAMEQRGLAMPMVILSGHSMEDELKDLQAQGLAGWLPKPPSMEKLSQLLSRALKQD